MCVCQLSHSTIPGELHVHASPAVAKVYRIIGTALRAGAGDALLVQRAFAKSTPLRLLTPRLRVLLGLFAALELGGALGVVPWETVPHAHAGHLGGLALGALMGML